MLQRVLRTNVTFPVFFTKYSAARPPSSKEERYSQTTKPQMQPPITPQTIPKKSNKNLQIVDQYLVFQFHYSNSVTILIASNLYLPLAVALAQTIEKAIGTTLDAIRIPVK
jgi:hypothetical protein